MRGKGPEDLVMLVPSVPFITSPPSQGMSPESLQLDGTLIKHACLKLPSFCNEVTHIKEGWKDCGSVL